MEIAARPTPAALPSRLTFAGARRRRAARAGAGARRRPRQPSRITRAASSPISCSGTLTDVRSDQARRARVVDPGHRDLRPARRRRRAQAGQQADRHLVVDAEHRVREPVAASSVSAAAAPASNSKPPGSTTASAPAAAIAARSPRAGGRWCAAPPGPRRTRSAGGRARAGARSRRARRPRLSTSTLGQSRSRTASATTTEPRRPQLGDRRPQRRRLGDVLVAAAGEDHAGRVVVAQHVAGARARRPGRRSALQTIVRWPTRAATSSTPRAISAK